MAPPQSIDLNVQVSCDGSSSSHIQHKDYIVPEDFGAEGYRASATGALPDDTDALNATFAMASAEGKKVLIRRNRYYRFTSELFLWDDMSLIGDDQRGFLVADFASDIPHAINCGISAKQVPENPFIGTIREVGFIMKNAIALGRLISLWRSSGARIQANYHDSRTFQYSLTQAQNNNAYINGGQGQQYIREDVLIEENTVFADDAKDGGEGIGIGLFNGGTIRKNVIRGIGDDPIGVHFCHNMDIDDNIVDSTDGRIFLSHCTNMRVRRNKASRCRSRLDNEFQVGIALIYIGVEHAGINVAPGTFAPTNNLIEENLLYYPPGAKDNGQAVHIAGGRDIVLRKNKTICDSSLVTNTGLHIKSQVMSSGATWMDPTGLDPAGVFRVHNIYAELNEFGGMFPQKIQLTGQSVDYVGQVLLKSNTASQHQLFGLPATITNPQVSI